MQDGGFTVVTKRGEKDTTPVPYNESKGPRVARGAYRGSYRGDRGGYRGGRDGKQFEKVEE